MQAVWTQIRTDQIKVNFEKCQLTTRKHEKLPSMQRVKEGVDACALSAIRRRAVKSSGETAKLVRITCAFFGHSCNKDLIFMGKFVTYV